MNKRFSIMIVGGNGFIGQNLARYFIEKGHEVSVFDMKKPECEVPGVVYYEGDFFDDTSIDLITEKQDIVIHALSTINPGNSNVAYMRGYTNDFVQTVRLFDRLVLTKGKLLFLSSAGTIYGKYAGRPFEESDPLCPINHYGGVKLCVETAMRAFNEQQGTKLISCRITNPYGPGQDYSKGVGFIDAVIKSILRDQHLEIWGDGSVVRDFIYIEDVCRMINGLLYYEGDMRSFNISTGVGTSQIEIIRLFEKLGFHINVDCLPRRAVDVMCSIAKNDKIVSVTGIVPRLLEQGIKDYLIHLRMLKT